MTVVGNDGNDVEPVEVDKLIVGISETYDVEVTIPENKVMNFGQLPRTEQDIHRYGWVKEKKLKLRH